MRDRLSVRLREERTGETVRRAIQLDDGDLWWEVEAEAALRPPALTVHDMAATALVFRAMNRGQDLHVDGPVTRPLLEGLDEFIALWAAWRPDLYRRIDITAVEEVRPVEPAGDKAIAAFSGGLDASYTVWRHANGAAGRATRRLIGAALVHGLDLPLNEPAAFDRAARSARDSLTSLGLPMAIVRTNWRRIEVDWSMEFGIAVASCLRNWQGAASYALLGSDEDYGNLVSPWGGHPLHYQLASAPDFRVVYDGAAATRTHKTVAVAGWEAGMRNLRVCWQGPKTGANCGECEKCIRTKMNFLAAGQPLPAALPGMPTASQIAAIRLLNEPQLILLEEIARIAGENRIRAAWVDALQKRIRRARAALLFQRTFGLGLVPRLKARLKAVPVVRQAITSRHRRRLGVGAAA